MIKVKNIFSVGMLLCSMPFFGQIGVNTPLPNTTLDVVSSGKDNFADGIMVPRLTLKELTAKSETAYTVKHTSALIYLTDVSEGDRLGTRQEIVGVGFYYFDGAKWVPVIEDEKAREAEHKNVYNSDGTLQSDRIIAHKKNTLRVKENKDSQTSTLVIDGTKGNVGIGGEAAASNKLYVQSDKDPLKLSGIQKGSIGTDKMLVLNEEGVVKLGGTGREFLGELSVPTPAVFTLASTRDNFLNGTPAGVVDKVYMKQIKNGINGLTYNANTSDLTIPPGTYQMSMTYEAVHNATGCTISSYFFDFKTGSNQSRVRIHSTASHKQGQGSNHGGTISYVATLPYKTVIPIGLGRGQSGNCSGPGMSLLANSTQFLIYRIGD